MTAVCVTLKTTHKLETVQQTESSVTEFSRKNWRSEVTRAAGTKRYVWQPCWHR